MSGSLRLGLNLPLFLASLTTLFSGTFTGLIGIWAFLAWKLAVPEYIKVGHAHVSWWAVLILISALILPSLSLKPKVKRFIIWTSFLAPPLWLVCLSVYYISKAARGAIVPVPPTGGEFGPEYLVYGTGIFTMEVWFFAALLIVLLAALGFKHKAWADDPSAKAKPSPLELTSDIEIPKRIFLIPLLFGSLALAAGWFMTLIFKAPHRPIVPAALVQFHGHLLFFVVGYLLTLLTIKAVGASERAFRTAFWLGAVSMPLVALGFVLFIRFELHSLVYVIPSLGYYAMMLLGLACLLGWFGLKPMGEPFHYMRGAMIAAWILVLLMIALGPVLALVWDTHPNLTVTFKQLPGTPYPGPYPEHYLGTAPVGHTPRGLENAHLSPGSWSHVALFWLLTLLLFGRRLGQILGKPHLVYFVICNIEK